ncbi:SNF2-related protein [Roseisolibacter sp. H3M3-2]|uniref:SNF2-related protein n=1 Tax=Roseisolibacter sp. H3M3-2 TaxID=3031323 RepID=UPI0023DB4404|nr:SNF2-related protein [Roseisolibacter sp. H3M3-2]MDF1503192.1 SNF2-related protein [Roseisolibacter sp. H3M3-2]
MPAPQLTPALPSPSAEVRAEALARAERLAAGLFPHQVEGVAFLLGRRRAILADDMGLGKTRQSVVALTEAAPIGPWLVVCPASVKRNWAREIHAVRPDDAVHVVGPADPPEVGYTGWVVVNYDLLHRVDALLEDLPWTGMIFDEAHYLKNHTSQRSKHARELVAAAPDAVLYALTGTPLTNRPRDLFPLLQLVGHPMGRSFLPFAKRYCAAHHNGFGWVTDGASNLEELRVQLHGVMLRRTKEETLDLPPKLRAWVPVAVPEGTGRREMRKVVEQLLAGAIERRQGKGGGGTRAPGQDRVRLLADLTKARVAIAKAKAATTIEFVEGVLAQGEKVLVFGSFDEPLQRIAAHFGEQAVVLTGATPAAKRQQLVDRFQQDDGVRVFVGNIVAAGVGITLTAARQVVFNDLDWVPANHWQAEDRAYRIGQTGTVNVTYLVAERTIDDFVASVLSTKGALVDAVVEGRGDVPADGDLLAQLEGMLRAISPDIATLGDDVSGEDPVDRLLREVVASARTEEAGRGAEGKTTGARPSAEAVLALARVLSGPATERYRVPSGSKPGAFYVLDVDGGDVSCTCRGFEYRGACAHARALKQALVSGGALPEGFTPVVDR